LGKERYDNNTSRYFVPRNFILRGLDYNFFVLDYLMRLLRTTNQIVDEFRTRLQTLSETINYVRGKVDHMSGLMTLATGGVTELLKKMVTKKAKQWVDSGTDEINEAAKDAVDRAVTATTRKMRSATGKIKR
jgi:hypothetical protein